LGFCAASAAGFVATSAVGVIANEDISYQMPIGYILKDSNLVPTSGSAVATATVIPEMVEAKQLYERSVGLGRASLAPHLGCSRML
jgi:hypothetical protein